MSTELRSVLAELTPHLYLIYKVQFALPIKEMIKLAPPIFIYKKMTREFPIRLPSQSKGRSGIQKNRCDLFILYKICHNHLFSLHSATESHLGCSTTDTPYTNCSNFSPTCISSAPLLHRSHSLY